MVAYQDTIKIFNLYLVFTKLNSILKTIISDNIQNIHCGDIMDENELVNELGKLKDLQNNATNITIKTTKELVDTLNTMIEKHSDVIHEFINYIASDIIDSYSKLEMQRKECIDKYLGLYEIVFQEDSEFEISKPMKSLMEKQQEDIARWQQEVAPLIELKKINENTSDEKANEVLELFKNI